MCINLHSKQTWLAALLAIALGFTSLPATAMPSEAKVQKLERMRTFLGLMNDFMGVVDSVHGMSASPEKAAIYQLHKIEEIYKARGQHEKAVRMLNDILANTRNQTIRNAVYMRLGDLLKSKPQRALEMYEKALKENLQQAR